MMAKSYVKIVIVVLAVGLAMALCASFATYSIGPSSRLLMALKMGLA